MYLEMVKLTKLMEISAIGLIDRPVALESSGLARERIRYLPAKHGSAKTVSCIDRESPDCLHGTFIAGVLSALRDSPAAAICPACSLLVRPNFSETATGHD